MLKKRNKIYSPNEFNLSNSEMPLYQEYYSEYIDLFEEIFLLTEKQFLNKLTSNVNLNMGETINAYSKIAQAKVISTIKGRCYVTDIHNSKKIKEIMSSLGSKDETKKVPRLELSDFPPHCTKTSKAYHICGNELLRPQATEVDYVICLQCKMIYKPEQIHLYCKECGMEYYSSIEDENDYIENYLEPATWEVYHCKAVVDAKMKCPNCREILFYNKKKEIVKCKSCGFVSDPKKIPFKCSICRENFYSRARGYNDFCYKPMKMNIKKALIEKIPAKPTSIPCCQIDLRSVEFRHKRECKGILYLGNLNGNKIVVCSECRNVNYYKRNLWYCPKCDKKFKLEADDEEEEEIKPTKINNLLKDNHLKGHREKQKSEFEKPLNEITQNKYSSENNLNHLKESNKIVKPENSNKFYQRRSTAVPTFNINYKADYIEIIPVKKENNYNSESNQKKKIISNTISRKNFDLNMNLGSGSINANDLSNSNNILKKIKKNFIEPTENFYIEDFEFKEQIGEGTFGKIYRVVYKKNDESYAMKKIIAKTEEELNTMKKEYELEMSYSKKMKGKTTGIIKVYGIQKMKSEQSHYGLCVLMELASTDWEREIQRRGKIKQYYTEGELMQILKTLVRAMAELEKSGIAHRDIKPQNILIVNDLSYKICDFGEAKKIEQEEKYQEVRGTELYMSPILFKALKNNNRKVKHDCFKSDVFSLGFCMIFASTLMFRTLCDIRELNDMESINQILIRYLIARYSSEYVDLLLKMINLDEEKRMNFIELEKTVRD